MTIRAFVLALAIALPAVPAKASLPVIDFTAIEQAIEQVREAAQQIELLQQQVQQAINTVHSLTNIPQQLIGQAEGLIGSAIQNPLGDIAGNLQTLMTGSGVGVCMNGAGFLTRNQYYTPRGTDLAGAWMNNSATSLAGLMACTDQMMHSVQNRIDHLPELMSQLQACSDVSCTTAVNGRINLEIANIQAQQQQATLMGQQGSYIEQRQRDAAFQKMRQDYDTDRSSLGGNGGGNGGLIATNIAPDFGQ